MVPAADVDVARLHAALDERVDGEVRFDPGTRMLARTIRVLRPALQAGTRVVVLEPSCAAVFRSDDARLLAGQTRTLAEILGEAGWHTPPRPVVGRRAAIAQVHCHQHAIMGFDA